MKELVMTDSQIEKLILKLFELYAKEKGVIITLKKKERKEKQDEKKKA